MFFLNYLFIFILCALMLCLHVCLCEGGRSHGTELTDSCELPCGCWELNPGSVEEHSVLLSFEPSLQCPCHFLSLPDIGRITWHHFYLTVFCSPMPKGIIMNGFAIESISCIYSSFLPLFFACLFFMALYISFSPHYSNSYLRPGG